MNEVTKKMWLSKTVLNWHAEFNSGRITEKSRVDRPYELLHHARELLASHKNELAIADAISNLKRAVSIRLQHLDKLYNFSRIFPRNIGALERLEVVGLARPFIVRKLFELRNNIEHKDERPPSVERCNELSDVCWYFLKATDSACKTVPDGVSFQCNSGESAREPELWLEVWFEGDWNRELKVRGWLSPAELSDGKMIDAIPLIVNEIKKKAEAYPNKKEFSRSSNSARRDDEVYVVGNLDAHDDDYKRIIRAALSSL